MLEIVSNGLQSRFEAHRHDLTIRVGVPEPDQPAQLTSPDQLTQLTSEHRVKVTSEVIPNPVVHEQEPPLVPKVGFAPVSASTV